MSAARIRLAVVSPLPPVPTGPADFVGHLASYLARHADVLLLTNAPDTVPRALRDVADVREVTPQTLGLADLTIYHIANNDHQAFAVDAALSGPPGLLTLHDISQHHLVDYRFLGHGQPAKYRRILEAAHGTAGTALARLRGRVPPLQSEAFLFDCMGPVLSRHRGAIVHNAYAREMVATREPALPTYTIPHFAMPAEGDGASPAELGLDPSELLIAHFGYVTLPKRPLILLEAFARLLEDGTRARLIFGGAAEPHTHRVVRGALIDLGIEDRVVITGYLTEQRMYAMIRAADIVVSLRWPHVGESSGTVVQTLAAGRALVTQRIGSWADLPSDVIAEVPVADERTEVAAMHRAFRSLLDPERRRRLGASAREYVHHELDPDLYARRLVEAACDALAQHRTSPRVLRERACARIRRTHQQMRYAEFAPLSSRIPAAVGGERLLAVGLPVDCIEVLRREWGYEVTVAADADAMRSLSAGAFSVVAARDGALPSAWLPMLNSLLSASGLLIMQSAPDTSTSMDQGLLEHNGFAVDITGTVSVARKVHLPLDPNPLSVLAPAGATLHPDETAPQSNREESARADDEA